MLAKPAFRQLLITLAEMHSKLTTNHDRALVASVGSRPPSMSRDQSVLTVTCLSATSTVSRAQWYQPHPLNSTAQQQMCTQRNSHGCCQC